MQPSTTMIVIPCDGNDEFLDISTRLWLAQHGEPSLLVVDTCGKLDGNPELKSRLINDPRVEVASLNLKPATGFIHPSDPVCFAMDYAFSRCASRFVLATHVDCFPLHRGVAEFMESQCDADSPVVGWEMSPRGPDAERAWREKTPYPSINRFSDGVMGHVCTMYDIEAMDRAGVTWTIRRGRHQFGLPRHRVEWGWPDTETTVAKVLQAARINQKFLGRETNFENQVTDHWIHARSARGGIHDRHRQALHMGRMLCQAWGV